MIEAFLREHAPLAPVPGCPELRMFQSAAIMDAWQAFVDAGGERAHPTYWAVVWPAGAFLARFLLDEPARVRGRRVLDLGCGGGILGIAAARAGAALVTCNDVDPTALRVAELNAAANQVAIQTDARDRLRAGSLDDADVVLAADILYERPTAARAAAALAGAADRGATVLLGEAGRPYAPGLEPRRVTVLRTARVSVPRDLEGVAERELRVLLYGRAA